jgi:phenylpropionate dioxygenase-like ring-hydroxylating dioxygenase large terminal subunit
MQRAVQERLIGEIEHYLDSGTTAMAGEVMRNPVVEYVDAARLAREKAELFRRYPLVLGHRSQVANPRDFFTDDVAGVPVLVCRQDDGSVRAFLNVCRHRGTTVVFEECGHRRAFTCPYHAWTYRSDGSLAAIPYDDGFAGLDRSTMGLVELPVEERHGLIWVVLTPGQPIDVASHLGALDEELASFAIEDYLLERSTVLRADMNWKIVVDGFLETYHLRFLHAGTIGPYLKTNLAPFEAFGRHGRMTVVRSSYDGVRDRIARGAEDLLPHVAGVYQIFPNTILIWQGDHFESWLVFPESDDPARVVIRVQLLAPRPTTSRDEQRHWDRNWKILMDTVLEEDFVVSQAIQRGFAVGAQDHVTFGRNEPALQHFHRALTDALGPAAADR